MAYLNKIEIIHESSGESFNYEFYSTDKMTPQEMYEDFTANLSIVPDVEEVDAVKCEECQEWTENYKQIMNSVLTICLKCDIKLADALEATNPRFNREIFLKACGVN